MKEAMEKTILQQLQLMQDLTAEADRMLHKDGMTPEMQFNLFSNMLGNMANLMDKIIAYVLDTD